jgi:cytochrome c oxidase subunit I+III
VASGLFAAAAILVWLWTGTALVPEKREKYVGFGVTLPLYMSGTKSVGWWAMLITMLGDATAFLSLVFGFFFYWTSRPDFLLEANGPGPLWPVLALALAAGAWALTVAGRRLNRRERGGPFQAALLGAALLAIAAAFALDAGPRRAGLDPQIHVYPATVWALVLWTIVHLALGVVMLLYCMARRLAGRLGPVHDIDIANVTLFWHFLAFTVVVTVAVIAGHPLLR